MPRITTHDLLNNILRQMVATIEQAHQDALDGGFDRPVILVLDLRDEQARAIAWRCSGYFPIDAMLAESRRRGQRPTLVTALERAEAIEVLAADYLKVARILVAPTPAGTFRAVAIAHGEALISEFGPSAPIPSAPTDSTRSPL